MLTDENRHTGSSYKQYAVITVKVISEVSGRCEETVRRHIRDEKFDPWDLKSIIKWVKDNRREE
jgi:predicted transcriptional regulator